MKLTIPSTKPLEEAREHALSLLNEAVSAAREAVLTNVSDQATTYQEKYQAALRYLATGTSEPYVATYAEIDGVSETDAANQIIQAHDAVQARSVEIEALRIKWRRAIMNAESTSAVYAALRTAKVEL